MQRVSDRQKGRDRCGESCHADLASSSEGAALYVALVGAFLLAASSSWEPPSGQIIDQANQ